MTGYDNLKCHSLLYNNITNKKIESIVDDLGIKDIIKKKVSSYSLGMKQKLSLAIAMLSKPSLLLLDEPLNGLDLNSSYTIKKYLKSLDKSTSVLISSHMLSDLEILCNRIFYLDNGKLSEINLDKSDDFAMVIFKVDNVKQSIKLIQEIFKIESINSKNNEISFNIINDDIPKVIELLIYNKIKIYSVCNRRKSLEEKYLNTLKGGVI